MVSKKFKKYGWIVLFLVLGCIAGYLYWYYVGCRTGSCPLTSKWYANTIWGGWMGYLTGDGFVALGKKHFKRKG